MSRRDGLSREEPSDAGCAESQREEVQDEEGGGVKGERGGTRYESSRA